MLRLISILLLFSSIFATTTTNVSIIAYDTQTFANSNHLFRFKDIDFDMSSSSVSVTYPAEYTIVANTLIAAPLAGMAPPITITYPPGYITITAASFFPQFAANEIYFAIYNLPNHGNTLTGDVCVTVQQSSTIQFQDCKQLVLTPAIIPDVLGVNPVQLVPQDSYTSKVNALHLKVTPLHIIPQGGSITLEAPLINPTAPVADQRQMFGNDMTCSGIANIDNDITCTLLANKITVTNGFKSADHNGSEITIEFTHFTNPHSLNQHGNFKLQTVHPTGGLINERSDVKVSVNFANTPSSFQLLSTVTQINGKTDITFNVLPRAFLYANSSIQLTFPSQFNLSNIAEIKVVGINNMQTGDITYVYSNNVFSLNNVILTYVEMLALTFKVTNINNFGEVTTSSSFQVKLIDENGFDAEIQSTGITYTTTPGPIYDIAITPTDATVQVSTSYTIAFKISNGMNATGKVKIEFPSTITASDVGPNVVCPSVIAGLANFAECTITSNVLEVTNGFPSGISPDDEISFTVDNIQNADIDGISQDLVITTYLTGGGADKTIDTSGNFEVNFNPGDITITTLSSLTTTITESDTVYKLIFQIEHSLPIGGLIEIVFPAEVDFAGIDLTSITCGYSVAQTPILSCQTLAQQVITITNSAELLANTTVEVEITGLQTPRHTHIIDDVVIKTKTQINGVVGLIDQSSSCPNLNIDQPKVLDGVTVVPDQWLLSQETDWQFTLTTKNTLLNTDVLEIVFPVPTITFIGDSNGDCECEPITGLPISLTCSWVGSDGLSILIPSKVFKNTEIAFKVGKIKNPTIKEAVKPLSYSFKTTNGDLISTLVDITGIEDFLPNPMSNFEVEISDSNVGTEAQQKFIIQNSDPILADSKLILTIPDAFTVNSILYTINTGFNNDILINKLGPQIIEISNLDAFIADSLLEITFNEVQNPDSNNFINNQPFKAQIVTSADLEYQEKEYGIPITFQCNPQCLDCEVTKDKCTRCNPGQKLLDSRCVTNCDDGYIANTSDECVQCTVNEMCLHCNPDEPTKCLVCKVGYVVIEGDCQEFELTEEIKTEIIKEIAIQEAAEGNSENSGDNVSEADPINKVEKIEEGEGIIYYNGRLQDFVYISTYLAIVSTYALWEKFSNSELKFNPTFLTYFSNVEIISQIAILVYYASLENITLASMMGLLVIASVVIQVICSSKMNQLLKNDDNFTNKYEQQKIVRVYAKVIRFYNFRFFAQFYSGAGPDKSIYNLNFSNPIEIFKIYKYSIIVTAIDTFCAMVISTVYLVTSDDWQILSLLLEFPIYCFLLLFITVFQLFTLKKTVSELENRVHNQIDVKKIPAVFVTQNQSAKKEKDMDSSRKQSDLSHDCDIEVSQNPSPKKLLQSGSKLKGQLQESSPANSKIPIDNSPINTEEERSHIVPKLFAPNLGAPNDANSNAPSSNRNRDRKKRQSSKSGLLTSNNNLQNTISDMGSPKDQTNILNSQAPNQNTELFNQYAQKGQRSFRIGSLNSEIPSKQPNNQKSSINKFEIDTLEKDDGLNMSQDELKDEENQPISPQNQLKKGDNKKRRSTRMKASNKSSQKQLIDIYGKSIPERVNESQQSSMQNLNGPQSKK